MLRRVINGDRCQVDAAVERAVKNCISAMWRIRGSVPPGRVVVAAGRLVVSPPIGPRADELIAGQETNKCFCLFCVGTMITGGSVYFSV